MMDWCKAHLPKDILAHMDLSQLELVSNEFITPLPDKLQSDVLYRCQIRDRPGYIFLYAEHQSTHHYMMAFRILEYVCRLIFVKAIPDYLLCCPSFYTTEKSLLIPTPPKSGIVLNMCDQKSLNISF